MKKFDQNANFQNCDQGVEMLFSVTFRDIPKIDNHGSNSHLAPNVCFGNDTFFWKSKYFSKKIHDFFETRIWGRLEYGWSVPWVQIPFKIHANRGVLDQICVVGPESGRGQSILGLLRVLRIPRHRFGTTRMPQPTFFSAPKDLSCKS